MVLKEDDVKSINMVEPEKVEICIKMCEQKQKDTIAVTIMTRAAKIQSGKFQPITIEVPKTSTLASLRRQVGMYCHKNFNADTDVAMGITFKEASKGMLFTREFNDMKMSSLATIAGNRGTTLELIMVLDGYGEGGGKRVSLTEPH